MGPTPIMRPGDSAGCSFFKQGRGPCFLHEQPVDHDRDVLDEKETYKENEDDFYRPHVPVIVFSRQKQKCSICNRISSDIWFLHTLSQQFFPSWKWTRRKRGRKVRRDIVFYSHIPGKHVHRNEEQRPYCYNSIEQSTFPALASGIYHDNQSYSTEDDVYDERR